MIFVIFGCGKPHKDIQSIQSTQSHIIHTKWIKQNRDKRVTIAKCTCGEEFFVRMRFRENTHDTFRVSVIVYPMSEAYRDYHRDLLEKQVLKEEKAKQYQNSL